MWSCIHSLQLNDLPAVIMVLTQPGKGPSVYPLQFGTFDITLTQDSKCVASTVVGGTPKSWQLEAVGPL